MNVLPQVEEQKRRAEADKLAAITALEHRSREFMREKEEKRRLETRIANMQSQLLIGGSKLEDTPVFRCPHQLDSTLPNVCLSCLALQAALIFNRGMRIPLDILFKSDEGSFEKHSWLQDAAGAGAAADARGVRDPAAGAGAGAHTCRAGQGPGTRLLEHAWFLC